MAIRARLARLAANPAGAIYGTIVAASVVAAAGGHDAQAGAIALTTVLTLLIFWLAHLYAHVLESRLRDERSQLTTVRTVVVEELAMIEAPAPSIVFLLLGAAGVYSSGLAVNLALGNAVVQLLLWGMLVARRLGRSWPATVVAGVVDASFGLAIIALKALLH
jgi:hypothetical protein